MLIHAALSFVLIAVVSLLPSCAEGGDQLSLEEVMAQMRRRHPHISHVSPEEVEHWMKGQDGDSRPLLLDVREAEEFEVSHLKGAVRVQPGAKVGELLDGALKGIGRDRRIVVYCSVGVRSAATAQRLTEAGFTNVHNMAGSIFQWANEGRSIYRGLEEASKVHPYDRQWGRYLKPSLRADR